MKYSIPKGLFDIFPEELDPVNSWRSVRKWQYIEQVIQGVMRDYGFREIRTPIFERSELFIRSVGDTSDIVMKEMYTFQDKAGRSMALRPEGTAPVMRAFVEKQMDRFGDKHKFFYMGPFFRYDRPQAGRFRQFHQLGVEYIGNELPEADVEIIAMLHEIYRRLDLKNLQVMVNSIGDLDARRKYVEKLKEYLAPYFDQLTKESQLRFEKNPLRILDTKDPKEIQLLENAPRITNYLSSHSLEHFEKIQALLEELKIPYQINDRLVRGLDYYNNTVFEISSDILGAQNTIGAGGRFDGLLTLLGGRDLPATGFATGIERILQTMEGQGCRIPFQPTCFIYFLPLDEESRKILFPVLFSLRNKGVPIEMQMKIRKIRKGLQQANKSGAEYCLISGSEEISSNQFKIKNMKSGQTFFASLEELEKTFQKLWSKSND